MPKYHLFAFKSPFEIDTASVGACIPQFLADSFLFKKFNIDYYLFPR